MTSRLKLWGGLVVLFCAGALGGAVADSMFLHAETTTSREHGPAAHHDRIMKRLTEGLSLTTQQQAEIDPIVSRAHVALLELRFAHQAEVEKILVGGVTDLKSKLSPAQQSELDRMYKGLERRWQGSRDYLEEQKRKLGSP